MEFSRFNIVLKFYRNYIKKIYKIKKSVNGLKYFKKICINETGLDI